MWLHRDGVAPAAVWQQPPAVLMPLHVARIFVNGVIVLFVDGVVVVFVNGAVVVVFVGGAVVGGLFEGGIIAGGAAVLLPNFAAAHHIGVDAAAVLHPLDAAAVLLAGTLYFLHPQIMLLL